MILKWVQWKGGALQKKCQQVTPKTTCGQFQLVIILVNGILWFGMDIAEVRQQTAAKLANFANLLPNVFASLFALAVVAVVLLLDKNQEDG